MAEPERLRAIADSVVRALVPVIDAHDVTEEELHEAARFLDRVGEAGVFASMLDIAFAMAIIDREREGVPGTRPNLEGPEYVAGAPRRDDGILIEQDLGRAVPRLHLSGHVLDARSGEPIPGAEIDLWHADEHGGYDREGFHLRGIVLTDADGRYEVRTLLPKDYAEHEGDPIGELLELMGRDSHRAAHIHFKLRVDGEECLTSQVFRGDSPFLDSDYVFGAVSDDLVLRLERLDSEPGREVYAARFDISVVTPEAPS
ncbi:MAG TPA: dioxygenase [Solirubrobacterales bacterium]|jgi:catechol 1,2-dioxygenase